ncbi:MAG: ADP-ribosylglycohydrolase family protein, partial [Akkermansia sp.]
IIGLQYEFIPCCSKDFTLFTPHCEFTDDSVMSLAICQALMDYRAGRGELPDLAVRQMQRLGHAYPDADYGASFRDWLDSPNPRPYNSFGNGSAMRIGAVAWVARDAEELRRLCRDVTVVTHNHPEGLKGAEATAMAAFLALHGETQEGIRAYIDAHYYPMDRSLEEIRPTCTFSERCMDSVPQALLCFLEARDYEDAIRNAVSLGADADTQAAIAGGIAECYFGIPEDIATTAAGYLSDELADILATFQAFYPDNIIP